MKWLLLRENMGTALPDSRALIFSELWILVMDTCGIAGALADCIASMLQILNLKGEHTSTFHQVEVVHGHRTYLPIDLL